MHFVNGFNPVHQVLDWQAAEGESAASRCGSPVMRARLLAVRIVWAVGSAPGCAW